MCQKKLSLIEISVSKMMTDYFIKVMPVSDIKNVEQIFSLTSHKSDIKVT